MNNLPIHQIAAETATRTSLHAVSISFFLALFPHFFRLPLWVSGVALFAVAWRSAQTYGLLKTIPKWVIVPMVLVGGVSVFAEFWTIVGRDPGLALLTVMTAFKFLETKSHRDVLILVFLCYFLLTTHFLFGQSMGIALYMIVILIVITTTLITINQRDESIKLAIPLKTASKLLALSIPLMIILFILVPRIPGPLWGLSSEQRGGITGLSDTMSPGSISNLITSNEVAFRVTFENDVPAQESLYWRGPILSEFDGSSWRQVESQNINRSDIPQTQSTVRYTVNLEPNGMRWLLALDIPTLIPEIGNMTRDFQLISKKPVNDLIRYSISSQLQYRLSPDEDFETLLLNSEIIENRNPQTLELGRQWANQDLTDREIINKALSMFRNDEYVYTLQPPLLGHHSSDEFLFQTRRGFCEHYASSFTLLMRAAGIPARVVTGYQGGEVNQVGNYLIVRQSDAHAWTEVWLQDTGWTRVDPTAAVSPDRIESGLGQALPDELAAFKFSRRNPFISALLFNWDSMKHNWNDMILNYDHRKQSRFLRELGLGIRSWGDMVIMLVIGVVTITGGYWLISWYRERPPAPPEYEKILNQLLTKLNRKGYHRRPSEHVYEFLERIKLEKNFEDKNLEQIFNTYNKIKYANGYQKKTIIDRFRKMVTEWKPLQG